jgi:hypothetical protein
VTARPLLLAVHSGGQTGVDIAALRAAASLGFTTGGVMPLGFRTHDGPRPEYAALYGCTEHNSPEWAPRTRANVDATDATLRIAEHMDSPGERCTANACRDLGKPVWSLHMTRGADGDLVLPPRDDLAVAVFGLRALAVKQRRPLVLNVAGNSERTAPGIEIAAEAMLLSLLPVIAAPLKVYTARVDYDGPDRLDITHSGLCKARDEGQPFRGAPWVPPWAILEPALAARKQATAARKAGRAEEARLIEAAAFEAYEPAFVAAMQASYRANRGAWDALLARVVVTAVCFCTDPNHCHRRIVARLLAKCGAEDMGERPRVHGRR